MQKLDISIYDYLFKLPLKNKFMDYQQKLNDIAEMQISDGNKKLSEVWGD